MMRGILAVLALTFAAADTVVAQDYPSRPVTMVVPFAAGGPIDVLGRILAPALGEALGQAVVIENVSGGGGMPGSYRVAQAQPDGYQFVLGSIGTHTLSPLLAKKPLYNPATDFAPVILVAEVPLVLMVRKDLPAKDLKEFIAYAKANHANMQYGSGGTGTSAHIGCVLLNQAMGVGVTHIPYRGGGPALGDLIAGRIDYICNYISIAVPAVEAGTIRALAIFSLSRSPVMPTLPTAEEQGLPGVDAYTWNAIFLPKNTPPAVVAKLNAAVSQAMDSATVRARLKTLGLDVVPKERRSPDYLAKYVAAEVAKWGPPIKASGIAEE
jgi:tripartite-type tricarboxylate transporter receptor subunit TctC